VNDKGFFASHAVAISLLVMVVLITLFVWHLIPIKSSVDPTAAEQDAPGSQLPQTQQNPAPTETDQLPTASRPHEQTTVVVNQELPLIPRLNPSMRMDIQQTVAIVSSTPALIETGPPLVAPSSSPLPPLGLLEAAPEGQPASAPQRETPSGSASVKTADLEDFTLKTKGLTLNNFLLSETAVVKSDGLVPKLRLRVCVRNQTADEKKISLMVVGLDENKEMLWACNVEDRAEASTLKLLPETQLSIPAGMLKRTATVSLRVYDTVLPKPTAYGQPCYPQTSLR